MKPVVIVTSPQLSDTGKQVLRDAGAEVSYMSEVNEDILATRLASGGINAVLMRGSPPFTRRVLEGAKDLKIIAKHGAGIDSVDLDVATARGIVVMNAGDANADPVVEVTIGMMLALARDLPRLDRTLKSGTWEKPSYLGHEFRGRVVGIVGYGQIGRRVAKLAAALGAKVVVYTRSRHADLGGAEIEVNLDRLLARVDILSLHCGLNDKTRGMIGARELGLMKRDAILINTARGPVVDEPALVEALKSGRLAAAGLDVFAKEPTDPKNPLFALDNVMVAPHVAAMTHEALARMGTIAATHIVDWLQRGVCDRANLINPAVLERARAG